jgi:hypothetical protein
MRLFTHFKNWFQNRRDRKAASLPTGYMDIVALYKQGLVTISGRGQSITEISVDITSRVTLPLRVSVPHGTYFVSRGNHQNMVTRRRYEFVLRPTGSECIRIPATCINASLPIPGSEDRFGGAARAPKDVCRFLEAAEGEDAMVVQAGVWALTDSYSRAQIQGTLRVRRHYGGLSSPGMDEGPAVSSRHLDRAKEILDSLDIRHRL